MRYGRDHYGSCDRLCDVDRRAAEQSRGAGSHDEKLAELTREVREHNEFARRMPVVEERLRGMEHRVEKLERGCGPERRPLS